MDVEIEFLAQLGLAAGVRRRTLELAPPCTAQDAVRAAVATDAELQRLVLDEHGDLQASILAFVADDQIDWATPRELRAGESIVLAPPIAGG